MKRIKNLTVLSLLMVFGMGSAYAETSPSKAEKSKAVATKSVEKEDKALKQFNQAFGIRLVGRKLVNNEAGKPVFVASYELENKGKQSIKAAHWIAAYIQNQTLLFAHDLPLNFDPALKAKSKITIDVNLPFDEIPAPAQAVIADSKAEISVINAAKKLEFSSKKVIEVK